MLTSGSWELIMMIWITVLAYELTAKPRSLMRSDAVTYLVDGTYRQWFWEVF